MSRATRLTPAEVTTIAGLLRTTDWSCKQIAGHVGRHASTVAGINESHRIRSYIWSGRAGIVFMVDGIEIDTLQTLEDQVKKVNGHWLWQGNVRDDGKMRNYNRETGRWEYAERVAWERERGPLAEGARLWRTCKKDRCITPAHHRVVTAAFIQQHGRAAKITLKDVQRIRRSKVSSNTIAQDYGISGRQVRRIRQGVRWKIVEIEPFVRGRAR